MLIQGELFKQGIIAIDQQSLQQLKARIVKDLPNVAKMLTTTHVGKGLSDHAAVCAAAIGRRAS